MEIIPQSRVKEPIFATDSDSQTQFSSDFNSFLTLLTTQLQNQDPLEPMETSEFTQQLVQYSGVEQSIIGNGYLSDLVDSNLTNQQIQATGYLGKVVDLEGNSLTLENGKASFQYLVDNSYSEVTAAIIDEKGAIVRTLEGEAIEGIRTLEWDGRDANGNPLKDGNYKVTVAGIAAGADEETPPIGLSTIISGKVDAISEDDNGRPLLTVNGIKRPITQVVAVRQPNN